MSGDAAPFLALIPSEHAERPNFVATVTVPVQAGADEIATVGSLPAAFDLDAAVGVQLDAVGVRVNQTRMVAGVNLSDANYRRLLRAVILANSWDGTTPGQYAVWAALWAGEDQRTLIQDNQDMSFFLALVGQIPDATNIALLTGGYIRIKPAGIRISGYAIPTVADVPLFGLDIENANVAGMDVGAWALFL